MYFCLEALGVTFIAITNHGVFKPFLNLFTGGNFPEFNLPRVRRAHRGKFFINKFSEDFKHFQMPVKSNIFRHFQW